MIFISLVGCCYVVCLLTMNLPGWQSNNRIISRGLLSTTLDTPGSGTTSSTWTGWALLWRRRQPLRGWRRRRCLGGWTGQVVPLWYRINRAVYPCPCYCRLTLILSHSLCYLTERCRRAVKLAPQACVPATVGWLWDCHIPCVTWRNVADVQSSLLRRRVSLLL